MMLLMEIETIFCGWVKFEMEIFIKWLYHQLDTSPELLKDGFQLPYGSPRVDNVPQKLTIKTVNGKWHDTFFLQNRFFDENFAANAWATCNCLSCGHCAWISVLETAWNRQLLVLETHVFRIFLQIKLCETKHNLHNCLGTIKLDMVCIFNGYCCSSLTLMHKRVLISNQLSHRAKIVV